LLVTIRQLDQVKDGTLISDDPSSRELITQKFSNFFNSYSKSYNNAHNRRGRLFLHPFKHKEVSDDSYFAYLINYIHRNPLHHGLVTNYEDWGFSSYNELLSDSKTFLEREGVLELFGSKEEFLKFHKLNKTHESLIDLIIE
jgi:hypothetical protein